MRRRLRRATLLAILSEPGEEAFAPIGSLVTSVWRGVRTVLVMAGGKTGEDEGALAAARRSAGLLGVESFFLWTQPDPMRLARLLRAFQPGVVVTNQTALGWSQQAWQLASDTSLSMPGLALFEANQSRLWLASSDKTSPVARMDVTGARPLLRALRFYYVGTQKASLLTTLPAPSDQPIFEQFLLLDGQPITGVLPTSDLFVGLVPFPTRPAFPPNQESTKNVAKEHS